MSVVGRFLDPNVDAHLLTVEGEVVIDEVRKHWAASAFWYAVMGLSVPLFLAMIWARGYFWVPMLLGLLALVVGLWKIHVVYMDRFVITNMRVFRVHGVFNTHLATMPMSRILDISMSRSLLGQILGYGHFVFESAVPTPVTLELKDAPFEQALKALSMASKTFTRVIGPKLIQVIPDTPAKRRDYEDQIVKTFYLSTADLKEVVDVLRISLGARRVAPLGSGNALTMNDTPEKIAAAERIIESLDKRHGEVVVEVEILEVNRQKLLDYGIEINSVNGAGLAATVTSGVSGGAFPDVSKAITLEGSDPYKKSNIIVSGLPGVIYRLLRTDGTSRLLANPQLRVTEGQTATARFGDQVPVPVTTFSAIATGGVAQQPITSFEYKNVGVNIDITPRVHHDGDVTLQLKLEISSLGAPGYNDLPTFSNRTVTSVLRLRDGETSILAGLITDREQTSLSGVPGLADIPLLGRIFGRTQRDMKETDIIMTLSPRIIFKPEFSETDLKSFSVGSESSPLLFEVPPATQPAPVIPPQAPVLLPTPTLRPEPIRPPGAPTPTPMPRL